MDIKVIASGSSGNCYLISDEKTKILLECGINISRLRKQLNFRLNDISACCITHEHKDHAAALKDVLNIGLDCYLSAGTMQAMGINHHRQHPIEAGKQFEIGSFIVLPFEVMHDAAEPLGFLIYSKHTKEKLFFATDTYYVRHKFSNLTHIMIECNYCIDILNKNIDSGAISPDRKSRILKSHMSIQNVKGFLSANDLSCVKEIYLMHLSDGNSNEVDFKRQIMALTGLPVYIC